MSALQITRDNDIQISSGSQSITIYGAQNQIQFNTNNVLSTIDQNGLTINGNLSMGSTSNITFSTSGITCDSLQITSGSNTSSFTNGECFTPVIIAPSITVTDLLTVNLQNSLQNNVQMGPTLTNYINQLLSEIIATGS